MSNIGYSILKGVAVFAADITPTKEDLFECPECGMPIKYRHGSERCCAHFVHPEDTWEIFCSYRKDAPKGYKRPSYEKTVQIIDRLEELEHITKKQARKVLQKTVAYIQGEWNAWKKESKKKGHVIKERDDRINTLEEQLQEAHDTRIHLKNTIERLDQWRKRCEKAEQALDTAPYRVVRVRCH